jgi:hypothetical protein
VTPVLWVLAGAGLIAALWVLLAAVTRSPAYQRWRYLGEHDRVYRPEPVPPVAASPEHADTDDAWDDVHAIAEHAQVLAVYRQLVDELYDAGEQAARPGSAP